MSTYPEPCGEHVIPRELDEALQDYREACLVANRTLAELLTHPAGSRTASHYADRLAQQVQRIVADAAYLRAVMGGTK